jgi:hypothetical protein
MSAQAHENEPDMGSVVTRAIGELPPESQGRVWQQLVEAARAFEKDDLAPMRRFIKNLYATTRLHANPAYRKALKAVAEPTEEPTELDLPALLNDLRDRRG